MAQTPQITGPCEVQVNTGAAGALISLGWSANGIEPRRSRLTVNVPGDQNGGDDGVPIDIQDMGGFYRVHMELTKWDSAVASNIRTLGNPITATGGGFTGLTLGTIPTVGALIIANSAYYRLLLKPTNASFYMNFLVAIPVDDPYSVMLSSKYSTLVLDWICYPNSSGVIWNTTIT